MMMQGSANLLRDGTLQRRGHCERLCALGEAFCGGRPYDYLEKKPKYECDKTFVYMYIYVCITGWRRPIGCLKVQVIFCK